MRKYREIKRVQIHEYLNHAQKPLFPPLSPWALEGGAAAAEERGHLGPEGTCHLEYFNLFV